MCLVLNSKVNIELIHINMFRAESFYLTILRHLEMEIVSSGLLNNVEVRCADTYLVQLKIHIKLLTLQKFHANSLLLTRSLSGHIHILYVIYVFIQ